MKTLLIPEERLDSVRTVLGQIGWDIQPRTRIQPNVQLKKLRGIMTDLLVLDAQAEEIGDFMEQNYNDPYSTVIPELINSSRVNIQNAYHRLSEIFDRGYESDA
jgi:hypothetical protein